MVQERPVFVNSASLVRACAALAAVVGLVHAGPSRTADAPPPVKPCAAAEYRQFDFWLGEWEVRDPEGKLVGHNRIARIHDGCALQESWQGQGGFSGTSLNLYDRERHRWHQTWVDSSGGLLQLDGGLAEGSMVLSGQSTTGDGRTVLQRIRWEPQAGGNVRQLWQSSRDRGMAWDTVFDGIYAKQR